MQQQTDDPLSRSPINIFKIYIFLTSYHLLWDIGEVGGCHADEKHGPVTSGITLTTWERSGGSKGREPAGKGNLLSYDSSKSCPSVYKAVDLK